MTDAVVRVGDRVILKKPRIIQRVGYPKDVEDYLPVAEDKFGKLIDAEFRYTHDHPKRQKVMRDLAYLYAKKDRFGGIERTIHWMDGTEFVGQRFLVEEVKTCITGSYYPPSWGRGYEDFDWEPGGLTDMKHHRIVVVMHYPKCLKLLIEDVEKVTT